MMDTAKDLADTAKDLRDTARQRLLDKGEEQGYITLEDILQEFPQAELHVDEISGIAVDDIGAKFHLRELVNWFDGCNG